MGARLDNRYRAAFKAGFGTANLARGVRSAGARSVRELLASGAHRNQE